MGDCHRLAASPGRRGRQRNRQRRARHNGAAHQGTSSSAAAAGSRNQASHCHAHALAAALLDVTAAQKRGRQYYERQGVIKRRKIAHGHCAGVA